MSKYLDKYPSLNFNDESETLDLLKELDIYSKILKNSGNSFSNIVNDLDDKINFDLNSIILLYSLKIKRNTKQYFNNFKNQLKQKTRKFIVHNKINHIWSEEKNEEMIYIKKIPFQELKFFLQIKFNDENNYWKHQNFDSKKISNIIIDSIFNSRFTINEMNARFNFQKKNNYQITNCKLFFEFIYYDFQIKIKILVKASF